MGENKVFLKTLQLIHVEIKSSCDRHSDCRSGLKIKNYPIIAFAKGQYIMFRTVRTV